MSVLVTLELLLDGLQLFLVVFNDFLFFLRLLLVDEVALLGDDYFFVHAFVGLLQLQVLVLLQQVLPFHLQKLLFGLHPPFLLLQQAQLQSSDGIF